MTLTITQPRELAKAIISHLKSSNGTMETAEGVITFYALQDFGTVGYPQDGNPEIDDVIDAYKSALIYELEKLSNKTWIMEV